MRATSTTGRAALIDECSDGEEIASVLSSAGYAIEYVHEDGAQDAGIVVRITARPPSTVVARRAAEQTSEQETLASRSRDAERERMEAVARLAGGVAHNLNNILSVISICAEEVLETGGRSEATYACLTDIRRAVERGASLTRDLLAFSQRDLKDPRRVDFNELVATAIDTIKHVVGDDVTVDTDLAATEPWVTVDASQWTSVFMNLALNARSAMPKGGSLTLRTQSVEMDPSVHGRAGPQGAYLEFSVTDTGAGMSAEIQPRIFEPFFTTKGSGSGSGLGLTVVHGAVTQCGGWIDVTSELDRGTTLKLYLPTSGSPPAPSTRRPTQRATSETRVLVVEDEGAVRRLAVRALERQGYSVLQAESAEDALAILAEDTVPIDLLVTDIVLPGMNGRRFAALLLEGQPDLSVLYMSGYTDDEVLRAGVAQQKLSYLQKPYTTKVLLARVDELLAARAETSST